MLISYEALYNTGADISCINEDIFRKIPVQNRRSRSIEHSTKRFTAAGGQALNVCGKCEITIEVLGREFIHPFYVIS
jgi:hypothetical protein